MAHVEVGGELGAGAVGAVNLQQKISSDGAPEDPDRKAGRADAGRQEDAAENDADVVDERSQRGDDETSLGVLNGAEDAALIKADLRREHQASKENHTLPLGGAESGSDNVDEFVSKDF